jgi:hypothetical protein
LVLPPNGHGVLFCLSLVLKLPFFALSTAKPPPNTPSTTAGVALSQAHGEMTVGAVEVGAGLCL